MTEPTPLEAAALVAARIREYLDSGPPRVMGADVLLERSLATIATLTDRVAELSGALRRIAALDPYGDWPEGDATITAQSIAAATLAPTPTGEPNDD